MTHALLAVSPTTLFALDRHRAHLISRILNPDTSEQETRKAREQHQHLSAPRAAQMKRQLLKLKVKRDA